MPMIGARNILHALEREVSSQYYGCIPSTTTRAGKTSTTPWMFNGKFKEPLDRQLNEKVNICRFKGDILMNRKSELGGAVVQREKYKYSRWGAGGT